MPAMQAGGGLATNEGGFVSISDDSMFRRMPTIEHAMIRVGFWGLASWRRTFDPPEVFPLREGTSPMMSKLEQRLVLEKQAMFFIKGVDNGLWRWRFA